MGWDGLQFIRGMARGRTENVRNNIFLGIGNGRIPIIDVDSVRNHGQNAWLHTKRNEALVVAGIPFTFRGQVP